MAKRSHEPADFARVRPWAAFPPKKGGAMERLVARQSANIAARLRCRSLQKKRRQRMPLGSPS
ncbi:hypothethical protein [Ralstonia solanacearum PSI07]|uniref:Hypothethical protein n=1 Tax=blood disease bacterium R229 TaxID=741978 RepID=G2ZVV7_9RALS|nr:hypothethical protein [Ralstonia solanacearum PSI07]CCA83238.1 hypothethical protein [blood disease bacterium R229]